MQLIVAAIWGALIQMLGTYVARILVSLGFAYVTFTGVNAALTWATNFFLTGVGWLSPAAYGIASQMKIGVCVSMLMSAVSARLVLNGLSAGGAITKMVQRGSV